jgi:hypothetical protein
MLSVPGTDFVNKLARQGHEIIDIRLRFDPVLWIAQTRR